MPEGSSSAAPVIRPGPRSAKNRRTWPVGRGWGITELVRPFPVFDLGHVVAVFGDVLLMIDQLIAQGLVRAGGATTKLGHAIDYIEREIKAIDIVQHAHIERSRRSAFFLIAAHM